MGTYSLYNLGQRVDRVMKIMNGRKAHTGVEKQQQHKIHTALTK